MPHEAHYADVLLRVREVEQTLWIGTSDIKDVFVKRGRRPPFSRGTRRPDRRGVSVRLIHAKEPGPNFPQGLRTAIPPSIEGLERVLCPRVHFKLLIFDLREAYIGSANLTGAGIGMKSDGKRNFEAGIWTNDPDLVSAAIAQFDSVWIGEPCDTCRRKAFCGDSIE
jgi:hypothetical protein